MFSTHPVLMLLILCASSCALNPKCTGSPPWASITSEPPLSRRASGVFRERAQRLAAHCHSSWTPGTNLGPGIKRGEKMSTAASLQGRGNVEGLSMTRRARLASLHIVQKSLLFFHGRSRPAATKNNGPSSLPAVTDYEIKEVSAGIWPQVDGKCRCRSYLKLLQTHLTAICHISLWAMNAAERGGLLRISRPSNGLLAALECFDSDFDLKPNINISQ